MIQIIVLKGGGRPPSTLGCREDRYGCRRNGNGHFHNGIHRTFVDAGRQEAIPAELGAVAKGQLTLLNACQTIDGIHHGLIVVGGEIEGFTLLANTLNKGLGIVLEGCGLKSTAFTQQRRKILDFNFGCGVGCAILQGYPIGLNCHMHSSLY